MFPMSPNAWVLKVLYSIINVNCCVKSLAVLCGSRNIVVQVPPTTRSDAPHILDGTARQSISLMFVEIIMEVEYVLHFK